jgi:hypothetical protein
LYAASARFYTEAFGVHAAFANDLVAGHRYNAARSAVLAGCGQGADDPRPDDRQRARLRRQAHDWLSADLAAWSKQLATGQLQDRGQLLGTLARWLEDNDLAGVRDKEILDKLPEEERLAWQKLWSDVEAIVVRATPPPAREGRPGS